MRSLQSQACAAVGDPTEIQRTQGRQKPVHPKCQDQTRTGASIPSFAAASAFQSGFRLMACCVPSFPSTTGKWTPQPLLNPGPGNPRDQRTSSSHKYPSPQTCSSTARFLQDCRFKLALSILPWQL